MKLSLKTYHEINEYLKESAAIIIPIGSTEQHSPDGILGTDFVIAEALADSVSDKLNCICTPCIPFGIATHHLGFAGTISLRPSVLIHLLEDILNSLIGHGFRQFFFINGHGGNDPSIRAFFSEILLNHRIKLDMVSWWHLPEVKRKEEELFGPQNGFHATISEISITKYLFPEILKEKTFSDSEYETKIPTAAWPLSAIAFKEYFPKGNMGSIPTLASKEKGEIIFHQAVDTICNEVKLFLKKKY